MVCTHTDGAERIELLRAHHILPCGATSRMAGRLGRNYTHLETCDVANRVTIERDALARIRGKIGSGDHLEDIDSGLPVGRKLSAIAERNERPLDQSPRRQHRWILGVARQHRAKMADFAPRQPRHAVFEPHVRPGAAMEAGRYTGTAAERGPQGRVAGFCAQLEVLRFSLAQPVLNYLGQPAATELERDERDRVRMTVPNSTGGRR